MDVLMPYPQKRRRLYKYLMKTDHVKIRLWAWSRSSLC